MKLKIVSPDGLSKTTRVYTENGEDISRYVSSIKIEINPASGFVKADVELIGLSVDVATYAAFSPNRFIKLLQTAWMKVSSISGR